MSAWRSLKLQNEHEKKKGKIRRSNNRWKILKTEKHMSCCRCFSGVNEKQYQVQIYIRVNFKFSLITLIIRNSWKKERKLSINMDVCFSCTNSAP